MGALDQVFRRGGMGRRILAGFLFVGLPPIALIATLAFLETEAIAKDRAVESLRADAKDYGIDILLRLDTLADRAEVLINSLERPEQPAPALFDYMLRDFKAAWVETSDGVSRRIKGSASNPINSDETAGLTTGSRPRLILRQGRNHADFLLVFRLPDAAGQGRRIVFELDGRALLQASPNAPFATGFCVFAVETARRIYCTQSEGALSIPGASDEKLQSEGLFWTFEGVDYTSVSWRLFLEAAYGGPLLEIVATRPLALAAAPESRLRRMLLPALVLVIALAVVLSFKTVGQSLVPLDRLADGANRLASGDLDARVRLRSGDEFEMLANSFNRMAERLASQFQTLKAMSRIDQQILASADLDTMAVSLLQHLKSLAGSEAVAIVSRNGEPHSGVAQLIALTDNGLVKKDTVFADADADSYGSAVEICVDDAAATASCRAIVEEIGMTHAYAIPVLSDRNLKGLILLADRQPLQIDEVLRRDCKELADRFAVALSTSQRAEDLYRQAHFDELTSLPNRQYFTDRLSDALRHAAIHLEDGAVLFLDLDRFKEINDLFGHSTGDLVLKASAERILSEVEDDDFVARFGGDEFVVLLADAERAEATAGRILSRLSEEITVLDTYHYVSASIGIVVFPDDGNSVETLLKNADSAMYRAKDLGRGRFEFFNVQLNAESQRRIELERQLRFAVNENLLDVYYQPQVSLATESICGAEALLRWDRGASGFVSPTEFIPIAEDSGLIVEIGRFVMERVCADLRELIEAGLHPGPVAVNVSARQFGDDRLLDCLMTALRRYDINPAFVHLEVTETTVAQNREIAISLLESARAEGIRVAIDDFGTGYSSLNYLQNLPFDILKIDKSFIDPIGSGTTADNICRTIIRMSEELGKMSVAEGVETREQADFLQRYGCDTAQGFYYSKPISLRDFRRYLENQSDHTQRRRALEAV